MQNYKLQTLRVIQNKQNLILNIEQKVMQKGKFAVSKALMKEFTKIKVQLMAK